MCLFKVILEQELLIQIWRVVKYILKLYAIEVTPQPTLVQVSGATSPQDVCIGDAIDPIVFAFGGGATSVEVQDLDPGLTVVPQGGGQ